MRSLMKLSRVPARNQPRAAAPPRTRRTLSQVVAPDLNDCRQVERPVRKVYVRSTGAKSWLLQCLLRKCYLANQKTLADYMVVVHLPAESKHVHRRSATGLPTSGHRRFYESVRYVATAAEVEALIGADECFMVDLSSMARETSLDGVSLESLEQYVAPRSIQTVAKVSFRGQ